MSRLLGLGLRNFGGISKNQIPDADITLSSPSNQDLLVSSYPVLGAYDPFTAYIDMNYTNAPTANARLFDFRTNNNDNIILYLYSNGNMQLIVKKSGSGASIFSLTQADYFLKQGSTRIAVSCSEDDVSVFVNGREIVSTRTGTTVSMPTVAPVVFSLGQTYGGSAAVDEKTLTFNEFKFYKKRLSYAQLKKLTRHSDYGVTAAYDSDKYGFFFNGQSNCTGINVASATRPTYSNLANLEKISKRGEIESYSDPASYDGSAAALFSDYDETGVFNYTGMVMDYVAENTGKDCVCLSLGKSARGLVDGGGDQFGPYTISSGFNIMNSLAYEGSIYEDILRLFAPMYFRIWHQGESDAGASVTGADYEAALGDLFALWNEYNSSPTVIVQLHNKDGYETIQAAQASFVADSSNKFYLSQSGDKATVSGDTTHWEAEGFIEGAYEIASQILASRNVIASPDDLTELYL